MNLNGFEILEYNQYKLSENVKYSVCPLCSSERKKNTQKCLSVFWDKGLAQCSHCGELIQLHTYKKRKTKREYVKPKFNNKTNLSDKIVKFFETRKISQYVLTRMKITEGFDYMPQYKTKVQTIRFNYFIDTELVNIKFKAPRKAYKLNKDSELIFYNLNAIQHEKECYITEGEIDCLSLLEIGINNAVSVPNGTTTKNINLDYLDNCIQYFENKEKIYICVDKDEAGENLEKELLRRIGAERCFYFDLDGCKDINEYHCKYGAENLRNLLKSPIKYPIFDIITMEDDGKALDDFLINGMPPGYGVGLKELDDNFTVDLGRYLIVTGIPTYGKTTVLDYFITRWNILHGWKIGICSPENFPVILHKERIITKILGYKPNSEKHVNSKAYKQVKSYIDENFFFMSFKDGNYELKRALEKGRELVTRKGIKVLVLDPYNKIRLKESINKGWTQYTTDYLNEIEQFSRANNVLIALIPHPNKMPKDATGKRTMPDFYDIKGGGEFFDMSPFGICVHKNKPDNTLTIKILKVKFAHLGTNEAEMIFKYNINNGRISEIDNLGNPIFDNNNWLKIKEIEQKQEKIIFNPEIDIKDLPENWYND